MKQIEINEFQPSNSGTMERKAALITDIATFLDAEELVMRPDTLRELLLTNGIGIYVGDVRVSERPNGINYLIGAVYRYCWFVKHDRTTAEKISRVFLSEDENGPDD